MRSLRKEFETGRQCWLDRQNTMEELRSARLLHKAFDVMSEFEKGRAQPQQLENILSSKVIECAGCGALDLARSLGDADQCHVRICIIGIHAPHGGGYFQRRSILGSRCIFSQISCVRRQLECRPVCA